MDRSATLSGAGTSRAEPRRGLGRRVRAGVGLFFIRILNYLTNHVVSHVPSFAFRRLWYSRVLGIPLGHHSGIHLGCYIWFYGPGQIRRSATRIGPYSRINRGCTLDLRGGLEIGENVSVSAETAILTMASMDNGRTHSESKPVVIEDHVWIGLRALIMPGVRLGRGSVVAAGAVVTQDVPPLTTVFGVPARPVGKRPESELEYVLDGRFPLFE